MTFLVNDNAKEQDYKVIVRTPTDGILNAEGKEVTANSAEGVITVSQQYECSFGEWEYYSKSKHVRYCDDCDKKEYKSHNWNDGEIIKQPAHGVEGEMEYTCEDCGYTKSVEIDALAHSFGDWQKCSETQHKRSCSCGEEEYESHYWGAGIVTKHPTASEPGIRTFTCDDCDATKTEEIPYDSILVSGIQLNETNITITRGNSTNLIATITPQNATNQNVIWTSSNPVIASVSSDGIVNANFAGTAIITTTTEDGGYTAQCEVTVERKADDNIGEDISVTEVTLTPLHDKLILDGKPSSTIVNATVYPENATNTKLIWENSDSSVVDMAFFDSSDHKALIVALSPGEAVITVTTVDGNFVAQCKIIVTANGEVTTEAPDTNNTETDVITPEIPVNTDNEIDVPITEASSNNVETEVIDKIEEETTSKSNENTIETTENLTERPTECPTDDEDETSAENKDKNDISITFGCKSFSGFSGVFIALIMPFIGAYFFNKKKKQ